MAENRVVQGRMMTPKALAELIEDATVLEADSITEADKKCPDCGGDVLEIRYMPTVTELVTGWKCQSCDWYADDRDR